MRVLMLSPHPDLPGPLPKHTPLLIDGLRGHGCTVANEPWGRASENESWRAKLPRLLKDVVRVRRVLAVERYDVVVLKTSHEWLSLSRDLPLLLAIRGRCGRIVVQFHGGRSDRLVASGHRLFKAASWVLFRVVDGVLVLSSQEARESAHFYPRGRFRIVSNPFMPSPGQIVSPMSPEDENRAPVILFASRLIAEKGIFDVLAALALLRSRLECRLIVAGRGPAEEEVAERIGTLGLGARVTLAGHLQRAEMDEAYRNADVFVLPTYWVEGFPTAITEAMSAGLPIVTTATRGIADHLEEGINALFVPSRSPAMLADALERLLIDRELRGRMAEANRDQVSQFAPTLVAERYLGALTELLESTGSGR